MRKRTGTALGIGTVLNLALGGILGAANGTPPQGPWWNVKDDLLYICGTWSEVPLLFGITLGVYWTCLIVVYGVCAPFIWARKHHHERNTW